MTAHVAVSQSILWDYVALTKPRVVLLLLCAALGGLFLASGGRPDISLSVVVLVAGALAAGGAGALNHSMERDLDELMSRTRSRPVVRGSIQPRQAMWFGVVLNVIAFALLSTLVNPLSAVLTLAASVFYVLVYTKALKRATTQNIVIGGAAGAIPPVVGWTAVTGGLELPALYLFAIVFFWTPPHFWALALILKDDYKKAGVPMLPVIVGTEETKTAILLYTFLVMALTLMFFTTRAVGWVYLASSMALGAAFIYYAWRLKRGTGIKGARSMFLFSMVYLMLLFVAIIADSVLAL